MDPLIPRIETKQISLSQNARCQKVEFEGRSFQGINTAALQDELKVTEGIENPASHQSVTFWEALKLTWLAARAHFTSSQEQIKEIRSEVSAIVAPSKQLSAESTDFKTSHKVTKEIPPLLQTTLTLVSTVSATLYGTYNGMRLTYYTARSKFESSEEKLKEIQYRMLSLDSPHDLPATQHAGYKVARDITMIAPRVLSGIGHLVQVILAPLSAPSGSRLPRVGYHLRNALINLLSPFQPLLRLTVTRVLLLGIPALIQNLVHYLSKKLGNEQSLTRSYSSILQSPNESREFATRFTSPEARKTAKQAFSSKINDYASSKLAVWAATGQWSEKFSSAIGTNFSKVEQLKNAISFHFSGVRSGRKVDPTTRYWVASKASSKLDEGRAQK